MGVAFDQFKEWFNDLRNPRWRMDKQQAACKEEKMKREMDREERHWQRRNQEEQKRAENERLRKLEQERQEKERLRKLEQERQEKLEQERQEKLEHERLLKKSLLGEAELLLTDARQLHETLRNMVNNHDYVSTHALLEKVRAAWIAVIDFCNHNGFIWSDNTEAYPHKEAEDNHTYLINYEHVIERSRQVYQQYQPFQYIQMSVDEKQGLQLQVETLKAALIRSERQTHELRKRVTGMVHAVNWEPYDKTQVMATCDIDLANGLFKHLDESQDVDEKAKTEAEVKAKQVETDAKATKAEADAKAKAEADARVNAEEDTKDTELYLEGLDLLDVMEFSDQLDLDDQNQPFTL
jgi:hypothetical protein